MTPTDWWASPRSNAMGPAAFSGLIAERRPGVALSRMADIPTVKKDRSGLQRETSLDMSSSLGLLDSLALGNDKSAHGGAASDPDVLNLIAQMKTLPDHVIADLADVLGVEAAPLFAGLTAVTERFSQANLPPRQFQAFRRERVAPMATARLSAVHDVLVGPDVWAAGLHPDTPRVSDERLGRSRLIRLELEKEVSKRLIEVWKRWPTTSSGPTAWPELWAALIGLAAACPADRLDLGASLSISQMAALTATALLGQAVSLPINRPSAPRLYAGCLANDGISDVVALEPVQIEGRLYLEADIGPMEGTVVVALDPSRTFGAGAAANVATFGGWCPDGAATTLKTLRSQVQLRSPGSARTDSGFFDDSVETMANSTGNGNVELKQMLPSVQAITVVRSARERIADEVLRRLTESSVRQLVADETATGWISQALEELAALDQLIPV